ncbi:membrane protein [Salinispora arenicola]|nr:membrane protein [Salinispora arenicola]
MTGLALTAVGVAVLPATDAVARTPTSARPGTPTPDRPSADGDRGKHDDGKHDDKGKDDKGRGKKGKKPKGVPVPCNTDKLIAAITLANARGGAVLDLATKCTYTLTTNIDGAGLPAITTPITLNGGKHTTITRAAAADQFRILTVNANGRLTLNHLTITGGYVDGTVGGEIFINTGGAATINSSRIIRNVANNGNGGGMYNNGGTLDIGHSVISHNTASDIGGGIFSVGAVSIDKSQLDGNVSLTGGGITIIGGVEITRSKVVNHRAAEGGGIFLFGGVIGKIADTRIERNTATVTGGSAIAGAPSQLTMSRVAIANNTAAGFGAVFLQGGSTLIEDSTIRDNTGANGGGIHNRGALTLLRTKVTGNQATESGGGISNSATGTLTLFGTKVVKNVAVTDGGGIFNQAGGTVELNIASGTFVVKNRPDNCAGDVPGCAG